MNSKFNILLFFLLLLVATSFSQVTFQRPFPDCQLGRAVQQTSDSGYVFCGYTGNPPRLSLVKTDPNGDTAWTQVYSDLNQNGRSVLQCLDGGYAVAGTYRLPFVDKLFLLKTNANGDTVWNNVIAHPAADFDGNSVDQTTDSGFVVVGRTDRYGFDQVYLVKLNSGGDTTWTRIIGTYSNQIGYTVRQTTDGGYIIGAGMGYGGRPLLVKTDSAGNSSWIKSYPGFKLFVSESGNMVQQTIDGGYIISCSDSAHNNFAALIKTDANGDTLWTKYYDGNIWGCGVEQTTDGGYVLMATLPPVNGASLIKTDSTGDTLWTRPFISPANGHALQQTKDGGYVLIGYDCGSNTTYLIKTDDNGILTGINEMPAKDLFTITVEPNPFSFFASIQILGPHLSESNFQFTLYDLIGREVCSKRIESENTRLERDQLQDGIYLFTIRDIGNGVVKSGKLVIQ